MTTDHAELLRARRLLCDARHICLQVGAQLLTEHSERTEHEQVFLREAKCSIDAALYWVDERILPDASAAPIELADIVETEE